MPKELYLNGIDADSGGPLDGELVITSEMLARVARGQRLSPEDLRDAKMRKSLDSANAAHFGTAEGIDNTDLAQAGWAAIFPAGLPPKSLSAIKEALKPLLDLRKQQAALTEERFYKEVSGAEGLRAGESKNEFLKRFNSGPGPVHPEKFPYYTLLVGSPEAIPFSFQYQLDVQYAVGRIYFERLEDYYQYASSVVAAETKKFTRGNTAAFFGVSNPDDPATSMSAKSLIKPLAGQMKKQYSDWDVQMVDSLKTTKANLANYMGGAQTPSLLFTASHGMSFKLGDARQLRHTGAILCQDWGGRSAHVPVTDKMYFSADDIASDADVFGMLAFVFACYGGGIPKSDNFYRQAFGEQKDIAPYAFLAQLPQRLLSHPRGGALGVFAHVDRAWGSSIEWDGAVQDIETFNSMVKALLNGKPAGAASEYFNERYGEIATMLTEELDSTSPENQDDVKLAGMWTSNNDARNYTFIGDPAVRLMVDAKKATKASRESLGAQISSIPAGLVAASVDFQPDVTPKAPAAGSQTESFGFLDGFNKQQPAAPAAAAPGAPVSVLPDGAKSFMDKLGKYLTQALDDITGLEVITYVAEDMSQIKHQPGQYTGAQVKARTHIAIDGDTEVVVPMVDGELDLDVWNIHLEMVKQAQSSRAELMKLLVSAASSLASLGK